MLDTAVIPCGGLGTRLQPITRWLPKELLPVGLRPVLYWMLDEIADAGLVRATPPNGGGRPARLVGRFVFPGDVFAELEASAQAAPAGHRSAVADFPART